MTTDTQTAGTRSPSPAPPSSRQPSAAPSRASEGRGGSSGRAVAPASVGIPPGDAFAQNLEALPRNVEKMLTGRAIYVDDVRFDGEASGVVVRSPHPHARIRTIDASAARSAPGVLAVQTGEDVARMAKPLPCVIPSAGLRTRQAAACRSSDPRGRPRAVRGRRSGFRRRRNDGAGERGGGAGKGRLRDYCTRTSSRAAEAAARPIDGADGGREEVSLRLAVRVYSFVIEAVRRAAQAR